LKGCFAETLIGVVVVAVVVAAAAAVASLTYYSAGLVTFAVAAAYPRHCFAVQ